MPVYRGVVKDSVVVLPKDVQLPEGATVEVCLAAPSSQAAEQEDLEELYKQRLLEVGLILEIRRPSRKPLSGDRTPITVQGKPLSEIIIEERR